MKIRGKSGSRCDGTYRSLVESEKYDAATWLSTRAIRSLNLTRDPHHTRNFLVFFSFFLSLLRCVCACVRVCSVPRWFATTYTHRRASLSINKTGNRGLPHLTAALNLFYEASLMAAVSVFVQLSWSVAFAICSSHIGQRNLKRIHNKQRRCAHYPSTSPRFMGFAAARVGGEGRKRARPLKLFLFAISLLLFFKTVFTIRRRGFAVEELTHGHFLFCFLFQR